MPTPGSNIRQRQIAQIGPGNLGPDVGTFPHTGPANRPPVPQSIPESFHDPRNSNLSGAASCPQIVVGGVVGTRAITILPANPNRRYLYIQNNSTAIMLVNYDGNAAAAGSIRIGPGGYYEPRVVPTNSVSIASLSLLHADYAIVEGVS